MTLESAPLNGTIWLGAGALSSVVALFVFLLVHHLWIRPIWFIAPAGLPIALVGGVAIGWSCSHLHRGPVTVAGTGLWLFGLIVIVLLPASLLSLTHGPLFDLQTATVPKGQGVAVAVRFCLELLATATITGALVGGYVGGTPQAALATALAGLAFAMGPGHNVPMSRCSRCRGGRARSERRTDPADHWPGCRVRGVRACGQNLSAASLTGLQGSSGLWVDIGFGRAIPRLCRAPGVARSRLGGSRVVQMPSDAPPRPCGGRRSAG